MRALVLAFFVVLTGFGVATAGEDGRTVEIKVVKSGDGADSQVHWIGDGSEFDDLAPGESKTLKDGVTVTRTDDGMTIDVDGEQIVMPDVGQHMAYVGNTEIHEDVDVHVVRMHKEHAKPVHALHDGIVVASATEIDADTQETIRSVLASAGYADEVNFVQPGKRRVKVEKRIKTIDSSN